MLGWATWYLTTWGGQTKTQLSADLNTSVRNMNVYADRVEQALKDPAGRARRLTVTTGSGSRHGSDSATQFAAGYPWS